MKQQNINVTNDFLKLLETKDYIFFQDIENNCTVLYRNDMTFVSDSQNFVSTVLSFEREKIKEDQTHTVYISKFLF